MAGKIDKFIEINQQLIESLNELLDTGNWDDSLFLRANKKRIIEYRKEAEALLTHMREIQEAASSEGKRKHLAQQEDQIKVFVSLYQSEYKNLERWERLLNDLSGQIISRPIYRKEEHIKAVIRAKADPRKEAYVAVLVKEVDIIKPYSGRKVTDRMGHELLTLNEKAILSDNIVEFVHDNKHYHFYDGRLQLKSDDDVID